MENHEFENTLKAPFLRYLRLGVCKKIFQRVLQQVMKAVTLNIIEQKKISAGIMYILDLPEANQNGVKVITVEYRTSKNFFVC